jgi:hypothetical protein
MFGPWLMIMHLVTYHLWLQTQGITTFDHIMYKREVERMKRDVKEGFMKPAEFDEWIKTAKPKAIEKRSKVIVRMDKLVIESESNNQNDNTEIHGHPTNNRVAPDSPEPL